MGREEVSFMLKLIDGIGGEPTIAGGTSRLLKKSALKDAVPAATI